MALIADFRVLLRWWRDELANGMPFPVKRGFRREVRHEVMLRVARSGISIEDSGEAQPFRMVASDLAGALLPVTLNLPYPVALILEPGRYLERRLAPFRLPARRAHSMALLDVASSTPFDVSDIVPLFPIDDPLPGARAFLVKRSVLAPLLDAIGRRSGRVERLAARVDGSLIELDLRDVRELTPRRRSWFASLAMAGSLLLAGTVAATVAHAHWRQGAAIAELDSTVGNLEAEMREVRILSDRRDQRLRQIEAARREKNDAVPVVLVWEELTRVLPDNAWVIDLTVSDNRLTFSGFSMRAASLLPLVEASPLFMQPAFSSPIVKSPANGAERFTIEAEIVR